MVCANSIATITRILFQQKQMASMFFFALISHFTYDS